LRTWELQTTKNLKEMDWKMNWKMEINFLFWKMVLIASKWGGPLSLSKTLEIILQLKIQKKYYGSVDEIEIKTNIHYNTPFDSGILIDFDLEKEIWDYHFKKFQVKPDETQLILTQPMFNPESCATKYVEFVFEDFGFQSLFLTEAPLMSMYNIKLGDIYSEFSQSSCNLIVDCGHSFTNIVPFYENQAIQQGIKRINVGGKLLSNYLKEMISTRIYDIRSDYFFCKSN